VAAVAACAAAVAANLWWSHSPKATHPAQPFRQITFDGGITTQAAFSPDGKLLAFASDRSQPGTLQLWLRQTAGGGVTRLTTEPGMEYNPQFSPDGTRLLYLAGNRAIYERPALGGPGRVILENAGPFAVSSKGEIAFIRTTITARPEPMWIAATEGVAPEPFLPQCRVATRPAWSPDGEKVLFIGDCGQNLRGPMIAARRGGAPRVIAPIPRIVAPATGMHGAWFRSPKEGVIYPEWGRLWRMEFGQPPTVLVSGAMSYASPAVSSTGDLIVTQTQDRTSAWTIALDSSGLPLDGAPSPVADAIGHFSVSRDGRILVFGRLSGAAAGELVVRDLAAGGERTIAEHDQLGVSFGSLWPQVAHDGRRVIYRVVGAQGGHFLLTTANLETRRVATMEQFQLGSDWSPDGKFVIGECPGPRAGICELDPDAQRVKTMLVHPKDQLLYPSWSWDGRAIAFMRRRTASATAIIIAAASGGKIAPENSWVEISESNTENSRPRFSPDGSLVYYIRGRNGQRTLVAQKIDRRRWTPLGQPVKLIGNPIELTAVSGANGPYPLISVTPKRLYYSTVNQSGNMWQTRIE
jgi:Tol biopolymer transport system component